MLTYHQSTGQLFQGDRQIGVGYSGNGSGLNEPDFDHIKGVGPLPKGLYRIGPAETFKHLGPLAMHLDPERTNQMHGRSGFFIHGDNADENYTASDGCIVLEHQVRSLIAHCGEYVLEVVA